MKTKKGKINDTAGLLQTPASLSGNPVDSKQPKESNIKKYRAMLFEKQITDTFEIIF